MKLKFETIVQFFRKIMQLNAVIILKSTNEYYRKIISKSGPKMDLYPAMILLDNKNWNAPNITWIAGTMVSRSSSVRVVAHLKLSQSTPTSADACGEVTSCHAGHQEVCRCSTRGWFQGMNICFHKTFKNCRTHSGFDTQKRRHQKSKSGIPVALNRSILSAWFAYDNIFFYTFLFLKLALH